MNSLLQAILVGTITGLFSAGAIYGVIMTEFKWLRRDVDELRVHLRESVKLWDGYRK